MAQNMNMLPAKLWHPGSKGGKIDYHHLSSDLHVCNLVYICPHKFIYKINMLK